MKLAVRYYSRGGNTKKVAQSIAQAVGVGAETIDSPLAAPVDVLFLGGALYAGGIDGALRSYIEALSPATVKCVAVFSTAAVKTSAYPQLKKLLEEKGISVTDREFHCRGQFAALHRGRPNADDLTEAAQFAKKIIEESVSHDNL